MTDETTVAPPATDASVEPAALAQEATAQPALDAATAPPVASDPIPAISVANDTAVESAPPSAAPVTLTVGEEAVAAHVQADDADLIASDTVTVEHDALRDMHGWFRHTLKLLVDHAKVFGLDIEAEIKRLL